MAALGDLLYRAASVWNRLAGNTSATRKFLRQTGTGAVSAAPAWDTLQAGDLPNTTVTPATYGDATHVGQFTVDQQGRVTAASNVAITATGTVTTTGSPASGNLTTFSGASSITSGDLSGDVTTSGTLATTIAANAVTTTKINNAAVTLAKIANAAASSKLVGSGASGSGSAYSEITLGTNLSMSGTTLNATASSSAFVKIDEATPSGTNVVTFSSLGSSNHLKLVYSARGTQSATSTSVQVTFNSDTTASYDEQRVVSANTTVTGDNDIGQTSFVDLIRVSGASAPSGAVGTGEMLITDYLGTTFHKQGVATTGWQSSTSSGGTQIQVRTFAWRNTAALTSITLTLASGNFVAGSKFTLYGMS